MWVLIMMSDDDIINLFVEDESLEIKLQNINVISFLTELTFTQMFQL